MSSTGYPIVGPINNGSKVMFATTVNGYLFFLTLNGNNLIFDPRDPTISGNNQPVIATVNIPNNSTNVSFSIVGANNVVVDTNGYAMNGTNTATPMKLTATDLNVGNIIVAGGFYTFNANGSTVDWYAYTPVPATNASGTDAFAPNIELDSSDNAVLQTFTSGIRLVPILYYYSNSCSTTPANVNAVIENEASYVLAQSNPSIGPQTGYTLQSDCQNGVFYSYCFLPADCGQSNNCFGACANTNQSCTLNKSNSTFSCTGSTSSTSWVFWVIIAVIALLLIILIIAALYWAFRPSSTAVATTGSQVTFAEPVATYYPAPSTQSLVSSTSIPYSEYSSETIL